MIPSARGPQLTANALNVLEKRYLWKNQDGKTIESPADLFRRVAKKVAQIEKKDKAFWEKAFFELMVTRKFLPNTPTLMNAGKPKGQLSACFVLPVNDNLDSIFETLKMAAKIHQSGGGTGFSFSRLRPNGSAVHTTGGRSTGPVSFIRIYDTTTDIIKQSGARRGANMAILRVDHPDIFEFINSKKDHQSILNFNISVGTTDEFMTAVMTERDYWIRDPKTGKGLRTLKAQMVFDQIVQAAWECGDPGMVFLDRINMFNPTPKVGEIESTNPCGEQPLLPYESCNLGSLNVSEYYSSGAFDWETFRQDIRTAVRFLDNIIDLNFYPIDECKEITLRNRKIGLGVMGFADLLLLMNTPYDSEQALDFGERLMSFLDREAKLESAELAKKRGAFPNWKGSLWDELGYPKMRNATVTTVAPTGTISIIAGTSSGIEPLYSGVFYRNVLSGEKLLEIHPAVRKAFAEKGVILENMNDDKISSVLGPAWTSASRVSVDSHIKMQAAFQRHSDSAVSKTINLPQNATQSDVARAYRLAYDLGCKGITVYRDKSKPAQVLVTVNSLEEFCPNC
jgi:ribonucleoside-diphosphate reductase alpha chain